jgi:hypothetical protein
MVWYPITPSAVTTTTGTLNRATSSSPRWTLYAGGFVNYATAKQIWDICHASYIVTKTINKLPDELSNCPFFIDPYAKNQFGDYIWATNGTPDLEVGDDHPAVYYARYLAQWVTWQKKQVHLEVADTSTYSALEIGTAVYLNDAKLTNGQQYRAWIYEKTQVPKTEKERERLRFGLILEQEGYTPDLDGLVIDEQGATDIIDELGATDIYDESGA